MSNEMLTLQDCANKLAEVEKELAESKRENYALRDHNGAQERQITTLRDKVTKLKDAARFFRAQRDRVDAYLSGVLDQVREERAASRGGPDHTTIEAKLRDVTRETDQMLDRYRMAQVSQRPRVNEPTASSFRESDGRSEFMGYRDAEPQGWEDL